MQKWWYWWVQHTPDYGVWLGPQWMTDSQAGRWHGELRQLTHMGARAVLRYLWTGSGWVIDRKETS